MRTVRVLGVVATIMAAGLAAAAEDGFALKDGDVCLAVGAGEPHWAYVEAFLRARFPNAKFRMAATSGWISDQTAKDFDADIAVWKPTVVFFEYEFTASMRMNTAQLAESVKDLVARAKALPARTFIVGPCPFYDGSIKGEWRTPPARRLNDVSELLKKAAKDEQVPFIDVFGFLFDVWGANKPREAAYQIYREAPWYTRDKSLPGVAELQKFARACAEAKFQPVLLSGAGHDRFSSAAYHTIAAAILSQLQIDAVVGSATLKADGATVRQERCKVSDVTAKNGGLVFDRLDECGPWPMTEDGLGAARLIPSLPDLSKQMLTVEGLPAGTYAVVIDGEESATVTDKQLAAGWNMSLAYAKRFAKSANEPDALHRQRKGSIMLIAQARRKSDDKGLARAQKSLDDSEAKMAELCRPRKVHVEITPK